MYRCVVPRLVTGELLNRPRRRATHREMRTERVAQDGKSGFHVGSPRDPSHHHLNHFLRQRLALVVAQHSWTTRVSRRLQRGRQALRERHIPNAAPFGALT
jgi:hypothetical protein